jgi:signal peptide peptidase SppA
MKGSIINLVQGQIWAILPEQLDAIHNILFARYFGNGVDLEQVSIELGRELDNKFEVTHHQVQQHYAGTDGRTVKTAYNVGVVPIHGTIAKRMNMFHEVSGGVSTEILKKTIQDMVSNPDIDAIVLDIDSGGGTLDGTMELANAIFEARGVKPIVAYANGIMASAAYWIGSAADIVTAYETTSIGSIGVFTAHYDYSQQNEKMGVKPTFIYQGKYKTMGNEEEPLSPEAKDYLQKHVDQAFKLFVDSVAKNRDISTDDCMKNLVDGSQMFFASDAKERGLIDDIMSLEQTIEMAASMAAEGLGDKPGDQAYKANWIASMDITRTREHSDSQGDAITGDDFPKEENMNLSEFKEKHSDLYQQVFDAGKAEAHEKEVKLTAEVDALKAEKDKVASQLADQIVTTLQLDKELTIEKMTSKAKEEKIQADSIMNKILEASAIAESLHDKVRAMVDVNKFKTADGAFDAEAFTVAFTAEVADWEAKVPAGTNLGAGLAKTDDNDTTPQGAYSSENVEILSRYKKNKS